MMEQFVDLCGTIHDLRKAWNRHIRLFPHSLRAETLKLAKEGREETFVAKSHQLYGDSSSNVLTQLSLRDKKLSPSENHDAQSDQAPTNISEQKLPSLENDDNHFEWVFIDQFQSEEADHSVPAREKASPNVSEQSRDNTLEPSVPSVDNTPEPSVPSVDLVQGEHLSPEVPEQLRRDTPDPNVSSLDLIRVKQVAPEVSKQPREDISENPEVPEQLRRDTPDPNVSSLDLIRVKQVAPEVSKQPGEDISEPNVSSVDRLSHIANGTESLQASKEYLKEHDVQQQYDHESEQDLKPPLLENLSLNAQNDRPPNSVPSTSHRCESSEETRMLKGSMLESSCNASPNASLYSPLGTQASSRTEVEVVNPSSSASHQNRIPTQTHRQPQFTANSGGNWRQKNNSDRVRRNFKFGSRGHSQHRGHSQRRMHQQRQESPQKYPRAEMDAQMPTSQCYSNQPSQSSEGQNQYQEVAAHTNLTTNHAWHMPNVQQQSIAIVSESQPPAIPVAPQTSQYLMQSDGQYGLLQNNQSYNHMWQYYYYQQQQFLLQQQQLQLQQQQQHPQQQQYQQQLQQHYHQLQQNPFQQQQLQQLQQQQLQYNQQQQLSLQQPYQQQQQQLLYPQQPLQHQEQQPLQQQEEVEQREHQQQNTPSEIQT